MGAGAGAANGPQPGTSSTSGGGGVLHVSLQHTAVHWVRADGRLAGALDRCPLQRLAHCCQWSNSSWEWWWW